MKLKKIFVTSICAATLLTVFFSTFVPVSANSTESNCGCKNGSSWHSHFDNGCSEVVDSEIVGHYLYPDGVTYKIYLADGCCYCQYPNGETSWGVWGQDVNTLPHDTIPGLDYTANNSPKEIYTKQTINGNEQSYYRGIYGTTTIKFGNVIVPQIIHTAKTININEQDFNRNIFKTTLIKSGNVPKTQYYDFRAYIDYYCAFCYLGYSKNITYSWNCADSSVLIKNADTGNAKVAFTKKGTYTLECKYTIEWKDGSTNTYTDSITVNVK